MLKAVRNITSFSSWFEIPPLNRSKFLNSFRTARFAGPKLLKTHFSRTALGTFEKSNNFIVKILLFRPSRSMVPRKKKKVFNTDSTKSC